MKNKRLRLDEFLCLRERLVRSEIERIGHMGRARGFVRAVVISRLGFILAIDWEAMKPLGEKVWYSISVEDLKKEIRIFQKSTTDIYQQKNSNLFVVEIPSKGKLAINIGQYKIFLHPHINIFDYNSLPPWTDVEPL